MGFSILLHFLLLLVVISHNGASSSGEKELLSLRKLQWSHELQSGSPSNCYYQKSRTQNGATIFEMVHRDNCLGQTKNWDKKLRKRLNADNIRVWSIQSRIKNLLSSQKESSAQSQVPINPGIKLQTLNYIITITLGGRNVTMIVDTGSDLTWTQCQPCKQCYSQPEPLFNPLISPSYESVPCKSDICRTMEYAMGSRVCGAPATCNYAVTYGDGSYTRGELGQDRLVLGTTEVDRFIFGCGRNNKGLFGAASGLMGLGKSDLSMISQTSDVFGGVFSYCLPDADGGGGAGATSGSLVLGTDSSFYKNSTPISYTRLLPNPMFSNFYILNMTGTSVGGVSLQSPSFGKNGILIDSGTVITRVPPSIYKAIKAEFLKQFSGYPPAPSFSILDTCFNLSGYEEVNIPTVKMEFEGGVEMTVDVSGMFYFAKKDASQVCLALASLAYEDGIGIIGNYQQRNTRVVYDTKEMKLGFTKEICSFY